MYSYKHLKKYLADHPLGRLQFAIGSSSVFLSEGRLDSLETSPIYVGSDFGEDIREGSDAFIIVAGQNPSINAAYVGDTWPGSQVVWDQIHFNALDCSKLGKGETGGGSDGGWGPIRVMDMDRDCSACKVFIRGLGGALNRDFHVRVKDMRYNYYPYRNGKTLKQITVTGEDGVWIEFPCEFTENFDDFVVEVQELYTGVVKRVSVPDFRRVYVDASAKTRQPKFSVVHRPTPSDPCRYEILIEVDVPGEWATAVLEGKLSQEQHDDIDRYIGTMDLTTWFIKGSGPLYYLKGDLVPAGQNSITYFISGSGYRTIVVRINNCLYSFPVELPPCEIGLRCPVDRGRIPDKIKRDDEGQGRIFIELDQDMVGQGRPRASIVSSAIATDEGRGRSINNQFPILNRLS